MVQKDMLEFNSRNISNIGNYFFREYSVNNSTIGFNKKNKIKNSKTKKDNKEHKKIRQRNTKFPTI